MSQINTNIGDLLQRGILGGMGLYEEQARRRLAEQAQAAYEARATREEGRSDRRLGMQTEAHDLSMQAGRANLGYAASAEARAQGAYDRDVTMDGYRAQMADLELLLRKQQADDAMRAREVEGRYLQNSNSGLSPTEGMGSDDLPFLPDEGKKAITETPIARMRRQRMKGYMEEMYSDMEITGQLKYATVPQVEQWIEYKIPVDFDKLSLDVQQHFRGQLETQRQQLIDGQTISVGPDGMPVVDQGRRQQLESLDPRVLGTFIARFNQEQEIARRMQAAQALGIPPEAVLNLTGEQFGGVIKQQLDNAQPSLSFELQKAKADLDAAADLYRGLNGADGKQGLLTPPSAVDYKRARTGKPTGFFNTDADVQKVETSKLKVAAWEDYLAKARQLNAIGAAPASVPPANPEAQVMQYIGQQYAPPAGGAQLDAQEATLLEAFRAKYRRDPGPGDAAALLEIENMLRGL